MCQRSGVSLGPAGWPCTESPSAHAAPPRPTPRWSSSSEGYSAETQSTPTKTQRFTVMCRVKNKPQGDTVARYTDTTHHRDSSSKWALKDMDRFAGLLLPFGCIAIIWRQSNVKVESLCITEFIYLMTSGDLIRVLLACKVAEEFDQH